MRLKLWQIVLVFYVKVNILVLLMSLKLSKEQMSEMMVGRPISLHVRKR
jgi:hypothetical protein